MNQTNEAGNLLPTMHDFNGAEVRTISINNEPYFVAKDVCDVLEISNHIEALSKLDEDEKGGYVIPTQFGDKLTNCVNESGLYHLIFKSRKPQAKAFRKWVTAEVLPAIRKTGSYSVGEERKDVAKLLGALILHKKYNIQPCYSISDLYWILRRESDSNVTMQDAFDLLHSMGVMYDVSLTYFNQPTPFAMDEKIMEIKNFPYQKGKNRYCYNLSIPVITYDGLMNILSVWKNADMDKESQFENTLCR